MKKYYYSKYKASLAYTIYLNISHLPDPSAII